MNKNIRSQGLEEHLQNSKSKLVQAWFEDIIHTYPDKTAQFLQQQEDQFANPVGTTLHKELGNIFDELLQDESSENLVNYVDAIIRVRAVQDFSPSSATGIFFSLKKIVRKELRGSQEEYLQQLMNFEDKVDQLSQVAFDVYMNCREKIWELKAKEAQNRTKNLLRKNSDIEWKNAEED